MPQSRKLGEVIRKILEDGVKAEDIVILSRLRFENSVITDADWGGDFRIVPISEPIPGNARLPTIRFSTIHAFKGMESRVVVMCDVEKKPSEKTKALLYVGMSRAKCLLIVLQNG